MVMLANKQVVNPVEAFAPETSFLEKLKVATVALYLTLLTKLHFQQLPHCLPPPCVTICDNHARRDPFPFR